MATTPLPPPRPIDPGTAGASTLPGSDRRVPRDHRRLRDRFRALRVRSVVRERRLGRLLDRELGPVAVVLHDRRVPGSPATIDHLVVAASGVWVVEAVHERGRVVRRRRARRPGGAFLRTAGSRGMGLDDGPESRVDAVRACLEPMGFDWLDVHRVVCLTNARWGPAPRPFVIGDAHVTWGRSLVDRVAVPGPLGPDDMNAVAVELSARLPAAGA